VAEDTLCPLLHRVGEPAGSHRRQHGEPNAAWVTQQARNLAVARADVGARLRFLVHDRDPKFTRAFDQIFLGEAVRVLRTPVRAPRANAYAERWVRTVRTECLDWLLILNRTHLERVLRVYVRHYNHERPHRGLALATPEGRRQLAPTAPAASGHELPERCRGLPAEPDGPRARRTVSRREGRQ